MVQGLTGQVGRRAWCRGALTGVVGLLAGCSPRQQAPGNSSGGLATVAPEAEALSAPVLRPAQVRVRGTQVQPVSGLSLTLVGEAKGLVPERLTEGSVSVTYAWSDPQAWGYLVVEGPAAFTATDPQAAQTAAHSEQQELITAGLLPSSPQPLTWAGFSQAAFISWNQTTLPPGWNSPTSVDAAELLLVNAASQSFRVVAYGPRDGLQPGHPAWETLCGIGGDLLAPSASPISTPGASGTAPAGAEGPSSPPATGAAPQPPGGLEEGPTPPGDQG